MKSEVTMPRLIGGFHNERDLKTLHGLSKILDSSLYIRTNILYSLDFLPTIVESIRYEQPPEWVISDLFSNSIRLLLPLSFHETISDFSQYFT